ncbi:hypothetical protein M413DRAFT_77727 [Hebeloma cylindrosporum]|uniref:Isomerase YbhE n=1 Tax=Hebeloma cylindrosporum TaxID=76867 RepID=A0A0C2XFX1_HEBCY|nr:hypothetical protein M413DRAFT_77727 [Hebeloma cylindrosporum h7]
MAHRILVASNSSNITTLNFDPAAGSLEISSDVHVGHRPSWLTSHESHPAIVFTGLEQTDGKVVALRYDEHGKGEVISEASSAGQEPCYLLATRDEILIANYRSGTLGILPLSSSSELAASTTAIHLSGSGPNKRQDVSHPHQVIIHEEYQELFVPDLGSDIVRRFKKASDGSWKLRGHIGFALGSGPRHVAFYGGDLFTVLELTNKVVRHRLRPLPEFPVFVKSVSTMSNLPPAPNDFVASEILIPTTNSSFPTPYLYVSNRDDPSPEGDIISIFLIEGPDSLELIAEVRSGLRHLRGMEFGGPDDKFLIAGGARGGGVKVFERLEGGASLRLVAAIDSVEAPTGFLWL